MTLLDATAAPFWAGLADRGEAVAVLETEGGAQRRVSYAELADRVSDLAARLHGRNGERRLVLLPARNDLATVVGYLACLQGGHPVLLAQPGDSPPEGLLAAYDPDVVLDGEEPRERRPGSAHDLHPDLALLLSTSGSTGSPKLVRLSHTNLAANAAAIGASLGIRHDDVAATTLPLHYCYGLSVLNSHLAAGAGVALTTLSVVDPCFWRLVREAGVTTFPGVPHTFDLLDRIGLEDLDTSGLRYLTCAGGRLAPDAVRRFAELGRARGWDLVVMYGATEATARMAYLPPDLALTDPGTLGVPVPGGELDLDLDAAGTGPGVGELVYRGDNVMLGYAESAADLARGREVTELRTGDLARRTPEGHLEIVGRANRVAKVFGLRVDLDRVEALLAEAGVAGYAAETEGRVVVAAEVEPARVRAALDSGGPSLPASAVVVVEGAVPRLPSGKVDYAALAELGARRRDHETVLCTGVAGVFRAVLGRVARPEDTFVSLGGDSLSYVEASLRLERVLGTLPVGWHLRPVGELEGLRRVGGHVPPVGELEGLRRVGLGQGEGQGERQGEPARPATRPRNGLLGAVRRRVAGPTGRWFRTIETNVLLRAAAIVMIVGSHSNLFSLLGGAHLLVGLAGYNFARFQLGDRPRRERVAGLRRSITRLLVPTVLWLAFAAATSAKYSVLNVLLLNGVLGTREWSEGWHYWFVEALVWTLVALTVLLSVPAVDRAERRWPFWFPMGLAGLALLTRYDVVRLFDGDYIHRGHVIFWIFALGWAAAKAPSWRHRLVVTAAVVATVPGFFERDQDLREAIVIGGMALLVWLPTVRLPAGVARLSGLVASASLYVYLCHWQIYPYYEFRVPWLATGLSLAAGVVFWRVVARATPYAERWFGEIQDNRRWLSLRRCTRRDKFFAPEVGAA